MGSKMTTGLPDHFLKVRGSFNCQDWLPLFGVFGAKLYLILEELRDSDVCIRYNKRVNSFEYEASEGISVHLDFRVLNLNEEKTINGGKFLNFFPASIILDGAKLS